MPASAILALTTCPDETIARHLADALVEENLAACVNQLPGVVSTYRWRGQVESAREVLLVIKTTPAALDPLQRRIEALHPYELPEFVVLPISAGSERYLEWIRDNVRTSD